MMAESQEMHREAVRTVPGLLAAKATGTARDATVLLDGYHKQAEEKGVSACEAWMLLFVASFGWARSLAQHYADSLDVDLAALYTDMGVNAAAWAADHDEDAA